MTTATADLGQRNRRRRRNTPYLLLLPGLGFLALFFVLPMLFLASNSLQTGNIYDGYTLTWHWHTYVQVFSDYHQQFLRSFEYAGMATVAALAIAYPLAYVIAFKSGRFKNLLLVLVVAPFFVSFLVRTLAWQSILADDGYVADGLRTLHLLSSGGRLINTPFAVVCGLTYNFLPFMTLPLYASLEKIDIRLISAAADLYAGPATAFRKVTFPLSLPGVVAGTLLTFIPAAGDFVNVEFLGDPLHQMIGNVIEKRFLVQTDYPAASALSVLLMAAIIVLVILYTRRAGTEEIV
ncbi:MAG: spermidine/putrescine transport system permease protein [Frankiales bacterium]|jgi:spermidine/putrescine transport system permease protein|nr:spermidine/putrescine transport system permease protein [Frankiales bacterium]